MSAATVLSDRSVPANCNRTPSREQLEHAQEHWFHAWRDAVALLPAFFGGIDVLLSAKSVEDLKPDMAAIRENLPLVSYADEAYLISLVSFVDAAAARRLSDASACYVGLLGPITSKLTKVQRVALAELIRASE